MMPSPPSRQAAATDPVTALVDAVRRNGVTGTDAGEPGDSSSAGRVPVIVENGPETEASPVTDGVVCEPTCESSPGTTTNTVPPEAETRADGRDHAGRFAPGTSIGLATRRYGSEPKHGVRRFRESGVLSADLVAQQADDIAGFVADMGGAEHLTTAKRTLIEKAGETLTVSRLFAEDIAKRGAFTARGRVRATTTGYLATVDRVVRLLGLLGLERKARNVETLDAYLARTYGAQRPHDASRTADDGNVEADDERAPAGQADGSTGAPEPDRC